MILLVVNSVTVLFMVVYLTYAITLLELVYARMIMLPLTVQSVWSVSMGIQLSMKPVLYVRVPLLVTVTHCRVLLLMVMSHVYVMRNILAPTVMNVVMDTLEIHW